MKDSVLAVRPLAYVQYSPSWGCSHAPYSIVYLAPGHGLVCLGSGSDEEQAWDRAAQYLKRLNAFA